MRKVPDEMYENETFLNKFKEFEKVNVSIEKLVIALVMSVNISFMCFYLV